MRIAHILWSLGTGGAENMIVDIANEQAETNTVSLFVINDWIEKYILQRICPKVHLYLLRRKPGSHNPWPILKLNFLLAKFHPDIIHTHSFQLISLIYYPWAKKVRTIHNTYNNPIEYPRFELLISISKAVKDFTEAQGFESLEIDNGINTKKIRHERDLPFNDDCLHIVQVSRLAVGQKGQDILIKALSILANTMKVDNFVMHFIGDGDDAELLENLAKDVRIDKKVIFEGKKSQRWIYEHLCNYDFFIQPSRYEGFGLTVAEAMAAKVPILVSNIEGPMEIIEEGRFGMYFKSEDVDDCARQIKLFIDSGRNDKQIEAAYKHVLTHYDVSITAKKYLEAYQSLFSYKKR